ncbi:MAG: type III pantothenate kinase [Gemmatimonadota bacterium]
MQLAVDVGNTETVLGLFPADSLEIHAHWRYTTTVPRTPDELLLLIRGLLRESGVDPAGITRSVVGSVVPVQTELLRRTLGSLGDSQVLMLEGAAGLPIRLDVDEPRTVGADRIANTLAASELYERDAVVVDLGTATTYDCISADGGFVGGGSAPGLLAGEEWLSGHTAKLPRVEFRPPGKVVGRRTETCLQSGVFYSAVEAIDGVIRRICDEWGGGDTLVVATGGHARAVAAHVPSVETVNPHLTLIGLQLAGRHLGG